MLDCSANAFCASLPADVRAKLCEGCRRRLSKAGSLRLYDNFNRDVSIILDGVMSGSSFTGERDLDSVSVLPLFSLCLPGRPLSLDVTFFGEQTVDAMPYSYNDMTCLTDCCIATIDHELVRRLFEEDAEFRWCLAQAMMNLMGDGLQFCAIMRAGSVYAQVNLLMQKLMEFNLYLSRHDVATVLACNRTSVSRAFARAERERPDFFSRYTANKNRPITLP